MTPELASPSPNYHTMLTGRVLDNSDLTCVNPATRPVFSGTKVEVMTNQSLVRDHNRKATIATNHSERKLETSPSPIRIPRKSARRVAVNSRSAAPDLRGSSHSGLSQLLPHHPILHNSCQLIYSQFGLAIHQNDHQTRRRFVEWAQNEIAVVPDFHKRILFSDEAHFWLNGYVNKQNCRIWSEANPQGYVETPLHPEKLTVWCALWAGGILLQKR
ncbi:hypothetical protein TNCV_4542491 [Trichonephila clavipes]|nr:hypothetical protein TNCV_4542491 [Trichonephila clavipes]